MRFILTCELGRLTKWLRILGFDAVYSTFKSRPEIIIQSLREERIILTRNRKIGPTGGIRIIKIRHDDVREQLRQVLQELGITPEKAGLFSRCVVCNRKLEYISKETVKERVPGYVYNTQNDFVICPMCRRIYWHGTHWGNVRKLLAEVNASQKAD